MYFLDLFIIMIDLKWWWIIFVYILMYFGSWFLFGLFWWFLIYYCGENLCVDNVDFFMSVFFFLLEI